MQKVIENLKFNDGIKVISDNHLKIDQSIKGEAFLSLISGLYEAGYTYLNYIYYLHTEKKEFIKYFIYSPLKTTHIEIDFIFSAEKVSLQGKFFYSISEIYPAAGTLERDISLKNKILLVENACENFSGKSCDL